MDCHAFSSCSGYHLRPFFEQHRDLYKLTWYREVLHIATEETDIFLFPYGASLFWNASKATIETLLQQLIDFAIDPYEEKETDSFTFEYGDLIKVVDDLIILPDQDPLTKLAISHGIAQSVKLNAFETSIAKTFKATQSIPKNLATFGKVPLSRRAIRKKMGALFLERATISLHVDVLDLPEFFWEYPDLEPFYRMITNYLDVQARVEVLNRRLGILHDLLEMLGNELNHQHSSRLEWIIISLIVVEVAFSFWENVLKVF